VINWFEYPQILIGGDFRPPLVQEAFSKRVVYTWDETDFGMPSVYAPKILVPSYFFMSVFQTFGASLYVAQMMALFLMFFLSSILMFMFVKRITNGNVVASFVAALYLTSNLYMINDREITAIAFLDLALMILPCLIAFTEGIMKKSYKFIAFSGLLFVLTYGAFPNFRVVLMCSIALVMILLFTFVNGGLRIAYRREKASRLSGFSIDVNPLYTCLKYVAIFIFAGLLASIWITTMMWTNLGAFFQAYGQLGVTQYVLDIRLHDVLRLITKWGFYSGNFGQPYVPYANTYLHNPSIIFLSYLPPILAFASLLVSKSRKLTICLSATAVLFLALSAGFNPFFSQLYLALTSNIPLMLAFRESAQWSFFVIISFSILIGITISTLYNKFRRRTSRILVLSLAIIILLASAYPLTTGDVSRNYLDTNVKGAYFPDSYAELNNALSNEYWALLLPQRGTYDDYNFSGIPLNSGNPYPLIFSKPVISGLGTDYLQSNNLGLINNIYDSVATEEVNVAPEGNASASSIEKEGAVPGQTLVPAQAIDGNYSTRWASDHGMPQWLQIEWNTTQELSGIKIFFENAYASNYTIETWNDTKWATQTKVENNTNLACQYPFSQVVPATKLRINFTKASPFNLVSIWEMQAYVKQPATVPEFLGMLGIKYLVLEKDLMSGNTYNLTENLLAQNENYILSKEWNEVELYNNTFALQKLYAADNVLNYTTLYDMFQTINQTKWETLQTSALLNSSSQRTIENNALVLPENFSWIELSPTSYVAHMKSKGAFVLVLLESYDAHWKLSVNGSPVSEANHVEVNAFANGWIIDKTGELTISIEYEKQNTLYVSIIASLLLLALLMTFLNRKELKKSCTSIYLKLKGR
jgi:hypothetical protein